MRASGYTRRELIVIVVILVALFAVIIPAVQSAREQARRSNCADNLKQLVIGIHIYHDACKAFPARSGGTGYQWYQVDAEHPTEISSPIVTHQARLGAMAGLVCYMESGPESNSVLSNYSFLYHWAPYYPTKDTLAECTAAFGIRGRWAWEEGTFNERWFWTKKTIPCYQCPSDDTAICLRDVTKNCYGTSNYNFCSGDSLVYSNENDYWISASSKAEVPKELISQAYGISDFKTQRGIFGIRNFTRIKDITDGTSNTIAVSEQVKARPGETGDVVICASDFFPTPVAPAGCAARYRRPNYLLKSPGATSMLANVDYGPGYRWADGAGRFSGFSCALPPNGPSCSGWNDPWTPGYFTASSRHPGGVNVGMADGAVRFISDTIDTGDPQAPPPKPTDLGPSPYGVWGSLSTKSSGEVFVGDAF